jgi:uncharacterized damage-inducible protein DinB
MLRDMYSQEVAPALAVSVAQVEDTFRRLSSLVSGMTPEELAFTGPVENSTATLVAHLALTDLAYLHEIMGRQMPDALEAEFGPYQTPDGKLPRVTGKSAADLLARYGQVMELARTNLKTLTDAERPVAVPWWGRPATVRFVLWHMAQHSIHHQAHIQLLKAAYRKAQGT